MLIVALVLAVIGLAALVTAVVTSNELIAWVCIGASVIGVLLLIVDALRERSRGSAGSAGFDGADGADGVERADRGDETTIIPAVSEADVTEDYPDEPTEEAETSTVTADTGEDVSPDVSSEAKRD